MAVIDQNTGTSANPTPEVGVLGGTTIVVTHDSLTPTGQNPTAYLAATAVLGSVNIYSENGAVVFVSEPVNALGSVNLFADGGTINFGATAIGALGATNLVIENGGTAVATGGTLVGLLNGGGISFGAGGGVLDIEPSGSLLNLSASQAIAGFKPGDTVIDGAVNFANVVNYTVANSGGAQLVTFYNGSGTALGSLAFKAATFATTGTFPVTAGPLQVINGPNGSVEFVTCFLAGTHIAGADGEVLVEHLQPGDVVETVVQNEIVLQPLTWVGSRTVAVGRDAPDDAYPVRIAAGAFAEDCPKRDLLVTADHCIFVDNVLVPVRMLVNGGSVRFARDINVFTYYHLELHRHAILRSEGLMSESYLDTGNRGIFEQSEVVTLHPPVEMAPKSWSHDAVAPLAVERAVVEPIWRRLQARAQMLGLAPVAPVSAAQSRDFDVHLLTDEGVVLVPHQVTGSAYCFALPAGIGGVRLISATARPSDVVGPFVDDRRALGVLVGEMTLESQAASRQAASQVIAAHLSDAGLAGWHGPEAGGYRWTAGCAVLPLDMAMLADAPGLLRIEIARLGPFEADAAVSPAVIPAAVVKPGRHVA